MADSAANTSKKSMYPMCPRRTILPLSESCPPAPLDQVWLECGVTPEWSPVCSSLLFNAAADQLRVRWFGQHDARLRPLTPKHTSHADQRPASSIASYKPVEPGTSKVIDDLAAGRAFMDVRVCLCLELMR